MHVHTRVKDKVDAIEGAELQCNVCTLWKPASSFIAEKTGAHKGKSAPAYKTMCIVCNELRNSLRKTVAGVRSFPSVQEVKEALGSDTFVGALNQARHTQGHEEPSAPRKPLSTAERERRREARERRAGKPDMCYLVGMEGDRTAVKIGHSTNVWRRMAQYQAGNPRKLVVLGLIEGGQEKERELHQRFMHLHEDRFVGEWFRLDPAILGVFGVRKMP